MKRLALALSVVATLALLVVSSAPAQSTVAKAYAHTLYASTSGAGSTCSLASPCSITGVQTVERSDSKPDLILLRGGTYTLAATLAFTAADSNSTWQAYPGETPVISGGVDLTTGWTVDSGSVYKRTWSGHSRQLWVNGTRATRARSANGGGTWTTTANPMTAPASTIAGYARPQDVELVDITEWEVNRVHVASATGTAVTVVAQEFANARYHPATHIDAVNWFENARELVTSAGYWYHNRNSNTLYYQFRGGETPNTTTVIGGNLETLVTVTDTLGGSPLNLYFRGITFSFATWLDPDTYGYSGQQATIVYRNASGTAGSGGTSTYARTPGAIAIEQANGVTFAGCTFSHLGASAVALRYGAQYVTIENSTFTDVSASGIAIGDVTALTENAAPANERLSYDAAKNNILSSTGVEYFDAPAIVAWYTDHATIDHNEITAAAWSGISCGWSWSSAASVAGNNSIRFNRVNSYGTTTSDVGAIYVNGYQSGTVVAQNYASMVGYVSGFNHEFYLDSGVTGVTVDQNVCDQNQFRCLLAQSVGDPAVGNTFSNNYENATGNGDQIVGGNTVTGTTIGAFGAAALAIKNAAGRQ